MPDALFGKKISERLNVATSEVIDKIVEEALAVALENADSPTKWPIEIETETAKSIISNHRMLDALADKLSKYGISVYTGNNDYIVIDVVNMDDKIDSGTVSDEIMPDGTVSDEITLEEPKSEGLITAANARKVAVDCNTDRMNDSYNFVAKKILAEARAGGYSLDLSLSSKPISSNVQVIKRVAKKLLSMGYKVMSGKRMLVIEARPDYAKMKTLNIVWKK